MYWYQVTLLHLSDEDPIKLGWMIDMTQTDVKFSDKAKSVQEFHDAITRPNLLEDTLDVFIAKLAEFISADGIVSADEIVNICSEKVMPSLAELEAFMTLAFFEKEFKYCVNTFNQSKTANGKLLFGMMEPHLQHYAIGCTRPLPTFLGHLDVHVELGPIYRMVVTETDTIVMYHLKTRPTIILPRGVISRLDQFVRESQQQVDSVQYVPGVGVEYEFDTAALFETTPEQL
ncbi:uncharacterized protein LOC119084992 [Bradysia coprophila]|uniref:uncharacterized protein LOC119084992 n=1 Tax=Bradysia coprophila TaxID=38358 RepID=UPI00187DCC19|nr:uncharacterized protein LOC119084992 [Bradysia coprophila]